MLHILLNCDIKFKITAVDIIPHKIYMQVIYDYEIACTGKYVERIFSNDIL